MKIQKSKQILLLFSTALLFCGVTGVVIYHIISPEFVSEFLTLDGHMAPNKVQILNNTRNLSFWLGITLMVSAGIILSLTFMSNEKTYTIYNNYLTDIIDFDLEKIIRDQWKGISATCKKIFLVNLFIALLCHGFVLTNMIINWDGQTGLFFSGRSHIPSGRWFTAFLGIFSEGTFLPIPFGIFSFICLALSGLLLGNLWKCTSFLQMIVVSAFLICFPAFAVGFSYNWVCFIYPVSTVLTILAVQYALRPGINNLLISILCFTLMLGTYQGLMAFGYTLMFITFIIFFFKEKANSLFMIKRFALLGLLSPVIYRGITNLLLTFLNMEYVSYRGADLISVKYILQHFLKNLLLTYQATISFFAGVYLSMPGYLLISIVILLFMGLCVIAYLLVIRNQSKKYKVLLVLLLPLISPPFIFITQFLNVEINSLLIFGMIPIMTGSFYIIINYSTKFIASITYLIVGIILLGFVNRNNIIHLKNYLWTQTSLQLAADVAIKIGALPDFSPEMKIVRVGNLSQHKFPLNNRAPFDEQAMSMITATGIGTYGEAETMNGIMHYLGLNYNPVSIDELNGDILDKIELMPIYPEKESIQIVEKYVIVKFSK